MGTVAAIIVITQWQTVHLLLDTYLLSYSVGVVFRASNSLNVDFRVLNLLLPWHSIPNSKNTTNNPFTISKNPSHFYAQLSSPSMQKPIILMHKLTIEETSILFPGNTLSKAKIRNSAKQIAFTQQTYLGTCEKLRKQAKEENMRTVIEIIALRIQILVFCSAHSSKYPSKTYTKSIKTMAIKRQSKFAAQTEKYSRYQKKAVPTISLKKRHINAAIKILIIHKPSLITFTFSDLQNMEHNKMRCIIATPENMISAFLFFTHQQLYVLHPYDSIVLQLRSSTLVLMIKRTKQAIRRTMMYPILMILLRVRLQQVSLLISVLKQQILLNIYNIRFYQILTLL